MNKMFKKVLCLAMVLTLALGVFAVSPIAAEPNIAVKVDKEGYLQGETVTATVYFPKEYNSLASLDINLTYTPSKLELVSVKSGKELEDAINSQINGRVFSENHKENGIIKWGIAGTNNFDFRGTFATVTFNVKATAISGKCELGLNVTNATNSGYVNLTSSVVSQGVAFDIIKVAANDLSFELTGDKKGYDIVGYKGGSVSKLTIPDKYAGLPVVGIAGSVFTSHGELKTVEIPSTVKRIGDNAFNGCRGLESIVIPDSVETIGSGAFSNCTKLKSITLPLGLEKLSSKLFSGCALLESIEIPFTVTKIESLAFENCESLTSVKISKRTTSIAADAFKRSFGLPDFKTVEGNTYLPEFINQNLAGAKIIYIKDLSLGTVTCPTSLAYTGSPLAPAISVSLTNGQRVSKGTDYKVVFKNNDKIGTATVYVAGIGDYGEGYINTFSIVCNHNFTNKTLTIAPTCTKDGYYTYTCSKCGETKTETVAAKGHVEGPWVISSYPTIFKEGVKYTTCNVCHEKVQHDVAIPKAFPDLDNDKRISSADALIVLQCAVNLRKITDANLRMNADTNGDQAINSSDALDILQISIGMITIDGYTA